MSLTPTYNENELLRLIAGGDEHAFSRLYHQTNRFIYNAVMAYVKNEHVTEELVQLTYIKLWNNRQSLTEVRNLDTYLYVLARNLAFDHFKKAVVEARLLEQLRDLRPSPVNEVEQKVETHDYQHLLQKAISQLPVQQKKVYIMANEQELSTAEIADRMQLSVFTAKRHLELARRFVRTYINQHLHASVCLPLTGLLINIP